MREGVKFETLESFDIKFGNGKFIEIAKKKAITEEGENQFISLSNGFFLPDGEKRYRKNFALPNDMEVLKEVVEDLNKFL